MDRRGGGGGGLYPFSAITLFILGSNNYSRPVTLYQLHTYHVCGYCMRGGVQMANCN